MIAAGVDGIKNKIDPGPSVTFNIYALSPEERAARGIPSLPGSLAEALDALEADEVIKEALGPHVCTHFISGKRIEWDVYRSQVHPWEIEQYLGVY